MCSWLLAWFCQCYTYEIVAMQAMIPNLEHTKNQSSAKYWHYDRIIKGLWDYDDCNCILTEKVVLRKWQPHPKFCIMVNSCCSIVVVTTLLKYYLPWLQMWNVFCTAAKNWMHKKDVCFEALTLDLSLSVPGDVSSPWVRVSTIYWMNYVVYAS